MIKAMGGPGGGAPPSAGAGGGGAPPGGGGGGSGGPPGIGGGGSGGPPGVGGNDNDNNLPHALHVRAVCHPATVASEGATQCTAEYYDSHAHHVASWKWSAADGKGEFLPGETSQDPRYKAPVNNGDHELEIPLTVTAVCDGPDPISAADSIQIKVRPTPPTRPRRTRGR